MNSKLLSRIYLDGDLDFYLDIHSSIFFMKNNYGILKIHMPKYFFFKFNERKDVIKLLFTNKFFFKTFLSLFKNNLKTLADFHFFRLRLRGLGFRLRKIGGNILRVFFGLNHHVYLFIPYKVLLRRRGRNLIVASNDKVVLKDFFVSLLLLRRFDFYTRTGGFREKNRIYFLKPKKKLL